MNLFMSESIQENKTRAGVDCGVNCTGSYEGVACSSADCLGGCRGQACYTNCIGGCYDRTCASGCSNFCGEILMFGRTAV